MKRPKLVSKWKDQGYQIEVREYHYLNGVRVIEAINPASIHFDLSVIVRGGAYFENQLGVPTGTAHMLEHIIYGQPNKRQKSTKEVNKYLYGTKSRPSIYANARTSKKNLYFYGSTHFKGAGRLLKSMRYRLDYPLNKIENYIEEERNVIMAEFTGWVKEERDERQQSINYLFGDKYPEYHSRTIGDEQSIKSITADDIRKFHKGTFKADGTVFALQVHEKLDQEKWDELNKLAGLFSNEPTDTKIDRYKLENKQYRYQHFNIPDNQSVFVSLSYFHEIFNHIDYDSSVMWYLANNLTNKVLYDTLRLDKQLIYSASAVNQIANWHWRLRGMRIECSKEDVVEALDEVHNIIHGGFTKFLNSSEGKQWFTSTISDYIFPGNRNYRSDYAEDQAISLLEDEDYKFDERKANRVAREVTIKDLIEHMSKNFKKEMPSMWVASPFEDSDIDKLMQKTIWYKKYHA